MIIRLQSSRDQEFAVAYVARKVRSTPDNLLGPYPYEVLAAINGGQFAGAVIYNNYRHPSIETHWAGEPGWLTRENLRGIFAYPFLTVGVKRITGIVHRKNKRARKIAEKIGFKLEGVCQDGFENGDACVYGMLRKSCRWI